MKKNKNKKIKGKGWKKAGKGIGGFVYAMADHIQLQKLCSEANVTYFFSFDGRKAAEESPLGLCCSPEFGCRTPLVALGSGVLDVEGRTLELVDLSVCVRFRMCCKFMSRDYSFSSSMRRGGNGIDGSYLR